MRLSRVALILGLIVSVTIAQLSDYLHESDRDDIKKAITGSKQSFLGLKTTYYTVSTLKKLQGQIPSNVCGDIAKVNAVDHEDIFYSIAINDALSCGNQVNVEKVKSGLKSESFRDLYFSVSSSLFLRAKKQVDDSDIVAAVQKLLTLGEDDGTFKSSSKSDEGSVLNGGLALQVLAKVASSDISTSSDLKSNLKDALKNAQELFSTYGEKEGNSLYLVDSESKASNLRVTSTVFTGFAALASSLKEKAKTPTRDHVTGITEYLLKRKHVSTSEDAYYVLEGLSTAASNNIGIPLAVSVPQASISASTKGEVVIRVTDALGADVAAQVLLLKAYAAGQDRSILTNQDITVSGAHKFNFLAAKPEPGFYNLELKVSPSDKSSLVYPINSVTRKVKVISTVTVADAQLTVSDSQDSQDITEGKKYSVESGKSIESVISVEEFQHIYLNFKIKSSSGKSVQAQQVFVRIGGDFEHISVAQFNGKQYSVHIPAEDLKEAFFGQSGSYEIQLIVGDSFIQNSIAWKVGSVNLKFTGEHQLPLSAFQNKPEIVHRFNPPAKRADPAISFAFTVATLAPLAIFLLGLLRLGANLSNFPVGGITFIYALGFQGTLGAILALYAIYWLQLNMMDTLKYLGVLSIPFLFFAMQTLNSLSISAEKPKRE